MEMQKNLPQLRFPEFNDEWEKIDLGDIAKFSKGKGISKIEISENGVTECIRYGQLYTEYSEVIKDVISKTNVDKKNLVLSEANDVIIPASGETQIDIATASCVIKSGIALGGDLNIIKTVNNGIFLSYYLNNRKKIDIANLAQGISVVHLYSSQLALLSLNLPQIPEQTKIANFFTAVDDKLIQLKKKKSLLEQYKKGVMQKIFSQELRFKDENGNEFPKWENKKLGEITFKVDKKNKSRENLPIYSINNVKGFIPQSEQFEGMDSNERGYDISLYKIIENNTFAYNPARINVGSIGYSGTLGRLIVSSLYVCFKTKEFINDLFFNYYIDTNHFKSSVIKNGEGGVRIYLFYENFSEISIEIPCFKEQTKIAYFLSAIDEKIKHCSVQIEKKELWKKGLLQKMFV
jgi:type I restriction enzyme S subunit